eukprot:comp5526_c0_seq1/m.1452 comp5526_c0_seq1/g.1452  ORF comp5526_c0_seq1/g.1452 comp5526_c0_seq1/m.1452 type:complete len:231 (-) comp5526_c0_seq1:351-1043(-)
MEVKVPFFENLSSTFAFDTSRGLPTAPFLDACMATQALFDVLGPKGFYLISVDITGNTKKVQDHYTHSSDKRHTIQALLLEEIRTNRHWDDGSMVEAVAAIRRVLEFLHVFLTHFESTDFDTYTCCDSAYAQTLRPHYSVFSRTVLGVAFKAAPSRHELVNIFTGVSEEAAASEAPSDFAHREARVNEEVRVYAKGIKNVLAVLRKFYVSMNLDPEEEEEGGKSTDHPQE